MSFCSRVFSSSVSEQPAEQRFPSQFLTSKRITLLVFAILGLTTTLVGFLGLTGMASMPAAAWAAVLPAGVLLTAASLFLLVRDLCKKKSIEEGEETAQNSVRNAQSTNSLGSEADGEVKRALFQSINRLKAGLSHLSTAVQENAPRKESVKSKKA